MHSDSLAVKCVSRLKLGQYLPAAYFKLANLGTVQHRLAYPIL